MPSLMSRRVIAALALLAVAVVAVAAYILVTVNVDRQITIGTGPVGSGGHTLALAVVDGLERRGFDAEIVTTQRTGDLIDLLADPEDPVDVSLVAGSIDARDYPNIESIGTMSRQGYVFVKWPQAPELGSLADIRGLQIDVGPEGSVRANFATAVLAEFGVTPENTDFVHLSSDATQAEAIAAGVDVTVSGLPDRREYLTRELASGEMTVIPIPEARAVAARIPGAQAAEVPYGAFSLVPPRPADQVPTVAQLVTVVADTRLSPAAVYAMTQEMVAQFSRGNEWREPGEFPNFSDRQLPANAEAAEFYATGSVPWQYQNLPPLIADSFVSLLVLGTLLLVLASVYSVFLPEAYSLWANVIRPRTEERYLTAMETTIADGRPLTPVDIQHLTRILAQHDAGRVLRERAERLRPHVTGPVDDGA